MSFNKWFLVSVFLFLGIDISAQSNQGKIVLNSYEFDQIYGSDFKFDAGSTAINNRLLLKFGLGGYVDYNMKSANLSRMNDMNTLGYSSDFSVFYRQEKRKFLGQEKLGWQLSLDWNSFTEMDFSRDLFQLILFGNAPFAGQKADLSDISFFYLNYYRFKFGLNKYSPNEKHFFLFNLSLNLGNQFSSFHSSNSNMYNSILGDSIALEADFQYHYLDIISKNNFDIYGFGGGFDFFYEFDGPKYNLKLFIKNLGFIHWGRWSKFVDYSQSSSFQGLEIPNILQMPNPLINTTLSDTISTLLETNSLQDRFILFTPADLGFSFVKPLIDNKIEIEPAIYYRLFSSYKTLYQIRLNYIFTEFFTVSPSLNYGGYANFNVGVEALWSFKKGGQMKVGTNYLSGLMLQNQLSGLGGYLSFNKKF